MNKTFSGCFGWLRNIPGIGRLFAKKEAVECDNQAGYSCAGPSRPLPPYNPSQVLVATSTPGLDVASIIHMMPGMQRIGNNLALAGGSSSEYCPAVLPMRTFRPVCDDIHDDFFNSPPNPPPRRSYLNAERADVNIIETVEVICHDVPWYELPEMSASF